MASENKDEMAMPLRVGGKYSIGGQLVTIKGKWNRTPNGESYVAEWSSPRDARDIRSGYLRMNNDGSFTLQDNSGRVVSQGTSGFGSASPIRASRPGEPDTFAVEDRFYFGKGRKERFEKEYVLWGLPKGETDRLHEKVLYTQAKTPAQMEAAKRRAAADGWHSFRVQILDLSKPFRWPV